MDLVDVVIQKVEAEFFHLAALASKLKTTWPIRRIFNCRYGL